MCEWDAGDLLAGWQARSRARLDDLGSVGAIARDDERAKAIFGLEGPVVRASFTAWSTGMLELVTSRAVGGGYQAAPEVFTEQCHGWSTAEAILDRWLLQLGVVASARPGDGR